jgi:small subunit ribosomal protein S4e
MSGHLKPYAAPKSWIFLRKAHTWITRPLPGANPIERSQPISLLLKQLGCAKTKRDVQQIINDRLVTIDGKAIKDRHAPVGFMDSIKINPDITLRGTLDEKGRLKFIEVPEKELGKKLCKIIGKHSSKGGKIQFNLSDGRNILTEKNQYAIGDSLLIEVPKQKIVDRFPLEKGNTVFLLEGRHTGTIGTIQEIKGEKLWCTKDKERIETLKRVAFVIGKDKPAIKL